RPVRATHEVAAFLTLREQRRTLTDVGVEPHAHTQPTLVQTCQHSLGVREHTRIPLEVAPVELPHPEAVEVEHVERNVAVRHSFNESRYRLLVVVGGEARRQPQSVGPRGYCRGTPDERRVPLEHALGTPTCDNEVLERFTCDRELHAFDRL